jgi:hypothetical protein
VGSTKLEFEENEEEGRRINRTYSGVATAIRIPRGLILLRLHIES